MAITVVTRPIGHKLSVTPHTAVVNQGYGGTDASFIEIGHGLSDGDYIYAESLIEEYNGFFYVDSITGDNFKLKEGPGADPVGWVANGTITYYVSTLDHGWSCVHLPIVYKLSNDRYPINTVDTERTVSSFTDVNGYTNLNLSGALKATVVDLDYVKISGAANDDLNGVWQIIDAVSTSDVTINLAYDAGNSFSGATVQFYYNNYHIRVKVFGGLSSTHQFEYLKPYRELSELRLIPDEDGQVMFSINEYLKALINTRNNLLLASLPCNIDFFTQFYISYAESYDVSDGSEVTTNVSAYTSDAFVDGWNSVVIDALNLWNENGVGEEWSNTVTPTVTLTDDQDSENKYVDEVMTAGSNYRINYSFDQNIISSTFPVYTASYRIRIKDASDNILLSTSILIFDPIGVYEFTAPVGAARISIDVIQETTSGTITAEYIINSITLEIDESTGFDGYAANAKLPFKNQYSGYLTEYIEGKWLTNQASPVIFDNQYFDLSAIVNQEGDIQVIINGDLSDTIEGASPGIYRIPITATGENMTVKLQMDGEDITDEITLTADNKCSDYPLYLTWLNNLGGFDYLEFQAKKDHIVEITETGITKQNIFPSWPQSYGSIADTIRKQTFRTSNKAFTIRSQHLTQAQVDAVSFIKSSVLVQILISRFDRRTVILDDGAFVIRKDGDDTYSISFNISYTDDIPVQSV